MVEEALIKKISEDFQGIKNIPNVLGVLLYGSYVYGWETPRSDIDICIVAPNWDLKEIYKEVCAKVEADPEIYDIRFYQELPLEIKGKIIDDGIVIISEDEPELYEFFYFNGRKEWEDLKFRLSRI